jgi:hypothetical protein
MCWLDTRFLSWWKVEIDLKENEFFPTFDLMTKPYFTIKTFQYFNGKKTLLNW